MVVKKDADDIKKAVLDDEVVSEEVKVPAKKKVAKKKIEEEEVEPTLVDLPGIGPAAVAKLEAAGIYDLMSLAVLPVATLSDGAGVSEAVARKAIQAARTMMKLDFVDGMEFAKKRANVTYITTGSKNVDSLLGGRGIESKAITEAFGAFGSGKTQMALSLAVNAQLSVEQGGAAGKAVYIDTEGTFRPDRIKQMAEGIGANPEMVLKNILVARAFNSDHQILLLDKISELVKNGEPIKLVIVDSLTAHFRSEYSGRGQLADRQQKLNRYMHNLMKLAETSNVAIYVTNQVMSNPAQMFGDPTTAIGGNIVGHASTYRMYLRRAKQGSRVAKLIDSPDMPDGEAVYFVTTAGIKDKA
ncbi:MAG: DNA repair and recombination protein RadA [Nanoarchaeota archaeon]|jgi:DNA repair protein RadA|nr:DNA repair and recombination protein RadA [Nanoarchaeota archaeon]